MAKYHYKLYKKQKSIDGITWVDVEPTEYIKMLVDYNCESENLPYLDVTCGTSTDPTGNQLLYHLNSDSALTLQEVNSYVLYDPTPAPASYKKWSGVLVLTDNVVEIGSNAFNRTLQEIPSTQTAYFNTVLDGVDFSNATNLKKIGVHAFNDQTFGVQNVLNIPDSVEEIDSSAFDGYNKQVYFSSASSISYIGGTAFGDASTVFFNTPIPPSAITIESQTESSVTYRSAFGSNTVIMVPAEYLNTYKQAWWPIARQITTGMFGVKFITYYNNASPVSKMCTSSTTLTSGELKPYGRDRTAMTSCEIGECVTTIGEDAFRYCSNLSSIEIPNNVLTIGNSAYYELSGVTSCTIGSGVTFISGYAFYNCKNIEGDIDLPSIERIGTYAFERCSKISAVTIGEHVTEIQMRAFQQCSNLKSVTILATTPPTLGSNAFWGIDDQTIYVPSASVETYKAASGWSTYADRIRAIGTQPCVDCFRFKANYNNGTSYSAECTTRTSITSADTRPTGYAITSMTDVEIGSCVTTLGNRVFRSSTNLVNATIPDSVTSIGNEAFFICESLSSITIPSSVTYIGDYVFQNCTSLTSITCLATTPPTLGSLPFHLTNDCPILVLSSLVNTYKAASGWSSYASRIQAIPT